MIKKTILYVEDELFMMGGIVESLEFDYEVLTARNADEAVKILKSDKKIDLIVLDIMMPSGEIIKDVNRGKTTGVGLANYIRDNISSKIPIICYTVYDDPSARKKLEKAKVNEIVSKERLPSYLEKIIKKYI